MTLPEGKMKPLRVYFMTHIRYPNGNASYKTITVSDDKRSLGQNKDAAARN